MREVNVGFTIPLYPNFICAIYYFWKSSKGNQSIHSVCPVAKNSQVCSCIKLRRQKALCLHHTGLTHVFFFLNSILGQCHQLTRTDTGSEIPPDTFQQFSLEMLVRILLGILQSPLSLRGLRRAIFLRGRKSSVFS